MYIKNNNASVCMALNEILIIEDNINSTANNTKIDCLIITIKTRNRRGK